jgi:hypothetical protein
MVGGLKEGKSIKSIREKGPFWRGEKGPFGRSKTAHFRGGGGGGGGGGGYLNNTLLANICTLDKPGPLGGDCRK